VDVGFTTAVEMADSGKWSCDRCRWDRLRYLEEDLENSLQQIEDLEDLSLFCTLQKSLDLLSLLQPSLAVTW
jgi:hypothetical protein